MELFKHQKEGIDFLKKRKKAILADDMGLGKTKQAIIASGSTSEKGTLVICPASLKINWQREIEMVYPEDIIRILSTNESIGESVLKQVSWFIINYDILEKKFEYIEGLVKRGMIDTIILDEAHYIKGKKAIRSDMALKLARLVDQVYCLTGTPIMNRPAELFNLLRAIDHPLGKVRTTFIKKYCGGQMIVMVQDLETGRMFRTTLKGQFAFRHNRKKYRVYMFLDETGSTNPEELHAETKDWILRRKKEDVLDLPDKIISTQICELGSWNKEYQGAWEKYVKWVAEHPDGKNLENILAAQQLIEIGKLKQVCSLAKITRIVEDVANIVDSAQKVIIFSQYTETIHTLAAQLATLKIGNVTFTGADDMDSRQMKVDRFQSKEDCKVFIGNIKAAGVGLNLTAASIVIFADMDWSPEIHAQAEDRAYRIGTKGTVNVYYYVTKDTIEEDIVGVLAEKKGMIEQVIEGGVAKGATSEILKKILRRVEAAKVVNL